MNSWERQFVQVSYVTGDYARGLEVIRRRFGLCDFLETGLVAVEVGEGRTAELRVALTVANGMQYELIEPVSGEVDLYRQVLQTGAQGIVRFHHFGIAAPSRESLDALQHKLEDAGQVIGIRGTFGSASAYFYLDARATLGHWLEYMYLEPGYVELIPRT